MLLRSTTCKSSLVSRTFQETDSSEDRNWIVTKGDELIANTHEEYGDFVLNKTDTYEFRCSPFRYPAGADLYVYVKQLMQDQKERGDTSNVQQMICQPNAKGEVISETEFGNLFCLLVAFGNDTLRYTLSAVMYALVVNPELLKMLHNTDAMFDAPIEVNLPRHPNRHMTFVQGGLHGCLSMWLSRLEVRVLLKQLVKNVKSIVLTDQPEYLCSSFVGSIKRLPVRIIRH